MKTSKLKFRIEQYTSKDFDAKRPRGRLAGMGDTPAVGEPTLDEQIAAYQREFQDLDPQVEKIVAALAG